MIDHEVPRCQKCNFILNPDVVLYGDTLPQYQNAIKRLYETDVLIVMGTSLKYNLSLHSRKSQREK